MVKSAYAENGRRRHNAVASADSAANPGSWLGLKCTVKGASHIRQGLQNQDWVEWCYCKSPDGAKRTFLAVADGHGSAKSFRSNRGARYAVEVVRRILVEYSGKYPSLTQI